MIFIHYILIDGEVNLNIQKNERLITACTGPPTDFIIYTVRR